VQENEDKLLREVETCVEAIANVLPELSAAQSPLAVVIALMLHANAAMDQAVRSGGCSVDKAAQLLKELGSHDVDPKRLRRCRQPH
jgi:hypothetical protein